MITIKRDNKRNTNNNIIKIENIDPNKVNNFYYYFKNLDIYTKFIISLRNVNNIYYYCSKKLNGCFGKIKYSLKEKNWYILKECDINIIQNTSNFEIFYKDYLENNLIKYNMQIKKFQKYYVISLYKSNISNNINNIIINLK